MTFAQTGDAAKSADKILLQDIKVLQKVGSGVTSVVWRAMYEGMEVAAKEMTHCTDRMPEKAKVNLRREIAILRMVEHPNLVKFVGVSEQAQKVMLITEFCAGGTVFNLIHNSDLDLEWPQRVKIARDVASAMEYLHACDPPIIHRDLKSLNLLLQNEVTSSTDEPLVKITDFGLSRMIESAGSGNVMTLNAGTYQWMAPEVFEDNAYEKKADVYSYSMILYEIICEEIPFDEVDPTRIVLLVCQGERPDEDAVNPSCPAYLHDLMLACWAQDADERPNFATINVILKMGRKASL